MIGYGTDIETISILGGHGKTGEPESVERVDFNMGDVVSIVGHTGSGKTTLINDIELFANADTPTGRRLLINDAPPPEEFRHNPARNPIALITQHTTFLSDLPVDEFLTTHAQIRSDAPQLAAQLVERTLAFANQLTGEPILVKSRMTELSGGQTRALLIADATILCNTPIILLDEVENAGIHRSRALELLREYRKIFIFVTHDPRIALLSDYRVVMKAGSIDKVIHTDADEQRLAVHVTRLDNILSDLRDQLRLGERVNGRAWEELK
jgi:ABC-type lipoprotein export system ATPase subunit